MAEPDGTVRSVGVIPNRPESIRKLVKRLGFPEQLRACYEAGPTGYVLYCQLTALGVRCEVVAPTLVPVKAGDRVKTDRRDALKLARSYRAGDLTPVWVPDAAHEALRDVVRAREAAKKDQLRALGEDRDGVSQHGFRGGNAFMLRMLNRYRDELQVTAPAADLERAADLTEAHLRTETAAVGSLNVRFAAGAVVVDVDVRNATGHKLPTAYPSRRAWIHLTARDQTGRTLFESGAPQADGSIVGNANDENTDAFEPHYTEITAADQVQIYESIIGDHNGNVTTALLRGVRYLKDNRLLPEGFDKGTVDEAVAVQGVAAADADFTGRGDRVRYRLEAGDGVTSVTVTARLLFQTIGYRWAQNLADYDAFETNRFVGYYEANADGSVMTLAEASAEGRR